MIIGLPKRILLTLPRAAKRAVRAEHVVAPKPRFGLFASFNRMMERHADLIVRGLGE